MMDRLAAMEAFARVAETGSFSAAARLLRLSKSQVSRQVGQLEAELGVRLLQRTTRSLSLTEAGRGYYDRVAQILAQVEEAELSVSRLQTAPRGRLRVSAPISFSILRLAPALPEFHALYPEILIDLSLNDRIVDLLDGEFDMAIRVGRLADSSLIARRLAPLTRFVCASPAYLAAHGAPLRPADLKGHAVLCYSNADRLEEWRFIGESVAVKGALCANNGDLLRSAALAGMGIADLPDFLVGEDVAAGRLVSLLDGFIAQDGAVHAVYPHSRHLSPKVRVFIDFLAERWGGDASAPAILP
jgi:DNA-binding transcriptional LysR family regulator